MTPTQEQQMEDVVFSIDIEATVKDAWHELTKVGEVQYPMFNAVLETDWSPGSPMYYYKPDRSRIFVVGKVVEVEPEKRFVHTYRFTDLNETESLVTWDFEEIPTGVRVTVTHGQWTDHEQTIKRVSGGWKMILKTLKAVVEGRKAPFMVRAIYTMMAAMDFMNPKQTLTENVLADERAKPGDAS